MGKYKFPIIFTCVFLFVFGTMVCIGRWQSIKLKSDLLNEAIISTIALLSLHMGLYHGNIIMWRATGIDYSKRFDFSAEEKLYTHPFRRLAEYLACVGIYFIASFIEIKEDQQQHLFILFFALVLITLRTIYAYRSDFRRIISFPSRKVTMIDVFLGDQMCSHVPGLRKIQYIFCYYITGSFKKQDYRFYETSTVYLVSSYFVSFVPFLCRIFQCRRKWYDEMQKIHLINLGKYVFAMLEAGARVAYENDKTAPVWLSLLVVVSIVATFYQLYWDFVEDWGLLRFSSTNRWLRDDLILSRKYIYYLSMGSNLILRFAWILTLILPIANLDDGDITFLVAVFEVIRRVQWNFFRLENEEFKESEKEKKKEQEEV